MTSLWSLNIYKIILCQKDSGSDCEKDTSGDCVYVTSEAMYLARRSVWGSGIRLGFGVKKNRGRIPRKWWTCGFMGIYIWIHLVLYSHSTFKHHDCGSLRCVLVVSLMVMVIINKLRPQVAEVFQWVSLGLCLPYSIRMDALGRSILAWRLPDVSPSIQPDLEWPKVRKQNPTAVEMCEI
jgi:hypothetical protein